MLTTALYLTAGLTLTALFLATPAWLLQASCAICDEEGPGFMKAFGVALFAAIASFVASVLFLPFGFAIGMLSSWLALAAKFFVVFLTGATVYSATLRISMPRGLRIAFVQYVLGIAAGWVWWFVGSQLWTWLW